MELLIVVIIVGILAGFSLVQYFRMTRRAYATEGVHLVGAVLDSEWAYLAENRIQYTGNPSELMLDLPPEGPNEHFDFEIYPAGNSGQRGFPTVRVFAVGEDDSPAAHMIVTGTMGPDGTR